MSRSKFENMIGPMLGSTKSGHIRILIGLPFQTKYEKIKCRLTNPTDQSDTREEPSEICKQPYNIAVFDFNNLKGETYFYKFYDRKNDLIDLGSTLSYIDCEFRVPNEFKETDSFIFMSCHNPFDSDNNSSGLPWAMWEKLLETIQQEPIKFLILAGDQVYNDEIEEYHKRFKWLEFFKIHSKNDIDNKIRNKFINQYYRFMDNPSYRKVIAKIPSIAIWDDHDITDGWGSRDEFLDCSGKIWPKWQQYYGIAREAFMNYQFSRFGQRVNPQSNTFTQFYDFGNNRVYLLDFRSERNHIKNLLWSENSFNDFVSSLDNTANVKSIENIFIISPVIACRTNLSVDKRISIVSQLLLKFNKIIDETYNFFLRPGLILGKWVKRLLSISVVGSVPCPFLNIFDSSFFAKCLLPVIGMIIAVVFILYWLKKIINIIPEISDDIIDGLTSESNITAFRKLIQKLQKTMNMENRKNIYLLSGDIHLGGLSEIILKNEGKTTCIPQIVASPISNKPMPKVVAGLTTTTSEIQISSEIFARNIFYISKRNFVQIFPSRLQRDSQDFQGIYFYLEGHQLPLVFPSTFHRAPQATQHET